MKLHVATLLLVALFAARGDAASPASAQPISHPGFTLENGIRVIVLTIPGSRNVSIFSFLPLGFADDPAGKAQWSHLLEHLVIRATHPSPTRDVNAETLADHMRLDFYGGLDNWRDGLSVHAQWLGEVAFSGESIEIEKRRVVDETRNVARRSATHKFAISAWAQGFRHGLDHAAVIADVRKAAVADVQRYRDEHLVALDNVLVCVVGGVDDQAVKAAATERLGRIKGIARPPARGRTFPGDRQMTWDLDARHVLLTWPIQNPDGDGFPALLVAGHVLMQRLYEDAELKRLTGRVFAGTDLHTPEGCFFYVSASVQADASVETVQQRLVSHLDALRSDPRTLAAGPVLARQLAQSLSQLPDLAAVRAQTPPNVSPGMVEANLGLQWAMQRYRYGGQLPGLTERLSTLTAEQCVAAVNQYLADDKCSRCTMTPASHREEAALIPQTNSETVSSGSAPAAWWNARQGGWIGAVFGSVLGCLGGAIGILSSKGKCRRLVLTALKALPVLGVGALALGLIALALSQPYAVYSTLFLLGSLFAVIPIVQLRRVRKQYAQVELRKMQALDA